MLCAWGVGGPFSFLGFLPFGDGVGDIWVVLLGEAREIKCRTQTMKCNLLTKWMGSLWFANKTVKLTQYLHVTETQKILLYYWQTKYLM